MNYLQSELTYLYRLTGFDPIPVEHKFKRFTSGLSEMTEGDESTLAEATLEEKALALRKEWVLLKNILV
jgi:hypothetical protein